MSLAFVDQERNINIVVVHYKKMNNNPIATSAKPVITINFFLL